MWSFLFFYFCRVIRKGEPVINTIFRYRRARLLVKGENEIIIRKKKKTFFNQITIGNWPFFEKSISFFLCVYLKKSWKKKKFYLFCASHSIEIVMWENKIDFTTFLSFFHFYEFRHHFFFTLFFFLSSKICPPYLQHFIFSCQNISFLQCIFFSLIL